MLQRLANSMKYVVDFIEAWDAVEFPDKARAPFGNRPNLALLAERVEVMPGANDSYVQLPSRRLSAYMGQHTNPKDCIVWLATSACRFWKTRLE